MAKQQSTAVATQDEPKEPKPVVVFRQELAKMEDQFAPMLPPHIPAERFARVVMNAVSREPKLLACDRRSLWNASMEAAEDGLLPDGREGAIVPFKGEAVWIPMVGGIRKLVRNSGEIADLNVQAVYKGEPFEWQFGDNPFIHHKPLPSDPYKRELVACYSIATFHNGGKSREIMFADEIHAVAQKSPAFKLGPWSDKLFYPEMAKKTCTKRHFKQLPTDRDLDRVLRRDDKLYDFDPKKDTEAAPPKIGRGAAAALAHFADASKPGLDEVPVDQPAGETISEAGGSPTAGANEPAGPSAPEAGNNERAPAPAGKATVATVPPTEDAKTAAQYEERFNSYLGLATSADAIAAKWKRDMTLRNKLNVEPERRERMEKAKADRIAALTAGDK